MSYLPVEEVQTDCTDRVCTCGNQALVTLTNPSDSDDDSFALGCVFAPGENRARWLQSGYLHVEALELILSNKLGDMSVYDIFMEYSIGLYTNDITKFVTKLESDGVEYLSLSWDQYISVLVHPPSSQLVFEIIAEADTSPDWLVKSAEVLTSPRFDFGEQSFPDGDRYFMHPLWVSNLATNVGEVREYFITLFDHLNPEFKVSTGVDALGASYKKLQIKLFLTEQDSPTQLRFIEPDKKSEGQFSVAWWEGYLNDVHDEFMFTPTCGWDILGDAHFSLSSWSQEKLDDLLGRAEEIKYSHFCQNLDNATVDCFFNSPFGVQINLKGPSLLANHYYSYEHVQQCATYNEWCDSEYVTNKVLNDDHENIGFAKEEAEDSAFSSGSTSDALWCTVGIAIAILGHIRIKPQREEKRSKRQKTFLASIRGHCNTPGKRTLTLGGKVHPDLTPVRDPDVITDSDNVLV